MTPAMFLAIFIGVPIFIVTMICLWFAISEEVDAYDDLEG